MILCVHTQDLTMFVNRISELVKHTLQQLASLHSPQAYVGTYVACVYSTSDTLRLYSTSDLSYCRTLNVMNANGIHLTVSSYTVAVHSQLCSVYIYSCIVC